MSASISYPVIAPSFQFEDTQNGLIEIKSAYKAVVATTANQEVLAAVTGKRIRVIGLACFSDGAVTAVNLKSGSGGATLFWALVPANTAGDTLILPITEFGYADTATGVGLFSDGFAVATRLCVRYIEYTQAV
jgi:hypothetical protein